MRDKVDHPRKGSKDLADAVCGSIYNAISRSKFNTLQEVQVHTYDSMIYDRDFKSEDDGKMNLSKAPKMPRELADIVDGMEIV